jgi:hypothetical protein
MELASVAGVNYIDIFAATMASLTGRLGKRSNTIEKTHPYHVFFALSAQPSWKLTALWITWYRNK